MGCGGSKSDDRLQTVDDSVHVMLKHDKKVQQRKGEAPHGYVPRAPHPLLQKQQQHEEEQQAQQKAQQAQQQQAQQAQTTNGGDGGVLAEEGAE